MITLDVIDPDKLTAVAYELVPANSTGSEYQVCLRLAPGASGIELLLCEDKKAVFRGELILDNPVPQTVTWQKRPGGKWRMSADGAHYRILAPDYQHERLLLWSKAADAPVDMVFLIDGTMRTLVEPNSSSEKSVSGVHRLVSNPVGRWDRIVSQLLELANLFQSSQLWCGVCAFGDHAVTHVHAPSLIPAYVVYPPQARDRKLAAFDPRQLQNALTSIPPTSGADWIDALADGLAACAMFPWRSGSRRLVVIVGESPGYSLLDPPPLAGNAQPRSLDVEQQTRRLHNLGIELVTIYVDSKSEVGVKPEQYFHENVSEYLDYARRQYATLASLPRYGQTYSTFDAGSLFQILSQQETVIARGIQPGFVV